MIQRYDTDEWARRLVQTRRLLLVPMTNAWGCANRRRDELNRDPNRDFPYEQARYAYYPNPILLLTLTLTLALALTLPSRSQRRA